MTKHMFAAVALALGLAGSIAVADAAPVKLVTEEAMVDSPQPGIKIYVRNKHLAGMNHFTPDRTLVFVHGATYPASTAFDLELGGLSWMEFIAQHGFDVYLLDLPGYGKSTRPPAMDQPPEGGQPVESTADAVRDYAAVVDWVLARRHLSKLDVMGWSWGTTIAGGYAAEQPAKVNRLVLYASVWLNHDAPPTGDAAKLGAYRLVNADAAMKRWLNGVPADKQAGLIPAGWFDAWQKATWATDPQAASANALRAPNGVTQDIRGYYMSGKTTYDPSKITAPTLMIQAEWDHDTPPYMSQALFPLLTGTPWKQYDLIGEGTHTVMMEKNRMQFFNAVQNFLETKGP
ncbi:MAG TPA: alpha/beta fold hydrolase [Aliidongia sp.]|nr:alpha/beta fold hydrolase [Aliidongia sp.]